MHPLASIAQTLSDALAPLTFSAPVATVYNPLTYAWEAHAEYLRRFGTAPREVLLVGMNPGPWGMAQTGVPFGAIPPARDWLQIRATIERPAHEHPKRPIQGFDCPRVEVSGDRLWGWARDRFGTPERFFARFFVWNYCPLMWMAESGRNITPDKLSKDERASIIVPCDRAVRDVSTYLDVKQAIGVGAYAEARLREALAGSDVVIGRVLHPSPASPVANRGWREAAERQLAELGVVLDEASTSGEAAPPGPLPPG